MIIDYNDKIAQVEELGELKIVDANTKRFFKKCFGSRLIDLNKKHMKEQTLDSESKVEQTLTIAKFFIERSEELTKILDTSYLTKNRVCCTIEVYKKMREI